MVNTRRPRGSAAPVAILRAAAHEFAARGYEGAGVDRIAAHARVNKAMLYYHYGSKLQIYREVLREMFHAVSARTRAIADSADPPAERLDAWVLAIVEEAAARPWFPPIMLRELASAAAHIDRETFGVMNGVFLSFKEIVDQGQRDGLFRQADPLLTYLTILPSILIFFARQRVVATRTTVRGLAAAAPRDVTEFARHAQGAARAMLRSQA